ncbi:hypothetical protein IEQ34_000598 [Dendrobium chrysotoxum]|uniref:Uncharacterized protein n=1 Tax=Dendrobium chrysotoxum TaxID=161865 RepID=A0AAV7HRS0_DENCH|nr:hypothetical protein IEQ34_000598 [Dendrobium chrysotoxum]
MTVDLRRELHIPDEHSFEHGYTGHLYGAFSAATIDPVSTDAGPSQPFFTQPTQDSTPGWYPHEYIPDSTSAGTVGPEEQGIIGVEQHVLHDRHQIGPLVLNSFLGQDYSVRFYTCESLYNIAKYEEAGDESYKEGLRSCKRPT